jgi:hypothetical protein
MVLLFIIRSQYQRQGVDSGLVDDTALSSHLLILYTSPNPYPWHTLSIPSRLVGQAALDELRPDADAADIQEVLLGAVQAQGNEIRAGKDRDQ